MSSIHLTPASVSYLTQFILSLAIAAFLISRLRKDKKGQLALLPFPCLLAALVFLLLFAYRSHRPFPRYTWESRVGFSDVLGV